MDIAAFALVFIDLFVTVFNILLLIRVLMSWVSPNPTGGIARFIFDVTEPLLAPLRRIIPGSNTIDFTPFAAYLIMFIIRTIAHNVLA